MPLDFESDEFLAAEAQRLGPGQEEQLEEMSQRAGAGVRVRELASVLVPMQHVSSVAFVDEEVSRMWSRFTGVEIRDGAAVPPEVPSQSPQGAATALLPPVPISQA
jgi:hypothetical protein